MKPEPISSKQWLKYNYYFIKEHFIGVKNSARGNREKMNRLFEEIGSQEEIQGRGETYDVRKIEHDSFEPFRNNKQQLLESPLVFRGVAKDWPAVQKWSKDFFREHYANTTISLIDNPGLVDSKHKNVFKKTSVGDYLKEVEEDKSKYLRFSRMLDNNPVLKEDLDIEWLRQFKSGACMGEQTFLFMGEDETITPMHAGFTHTLFIQVKGKKKWTICAPNERLFLNPLADRVLYYYTHADPKNPYDPRYPLLPYLKKYEITLDEGDVLWLPSLYWHYIENLTPTIGVAFKYTNIQQSFSISKVLTTLFFLATKPTIFKSFAYNRTHKQDYVFDKETVKYS